VLLFELNDRQIDQQENQREQRPEVNVARCDHQPDRDQQCSDIQRIARICVGSTGGELPVFRQAACGPGSQRQPDYRHRYAERERIRRRAGEPRENDHDQKSARDTESGYRIRVALGELEHKTVLRVSKTVSGEMARIAGSIDTPRL
jgi:hypothetical protein